LILQARGNKAELQRGEVQVANHLIESQMTLELQIDLVALNKTKILKISAIAM
jgi:hypothetical protein